MHSVAWLGYYERNALKIINDTTLKRTKCRYNNKLLKQRELNKGLFYKFLGANEAFVCHIEHAKTINVVVLVA